MAEKEKLSKYDPKSTEGFQDPVLRCDTCAKIVKNETIHKLGACPNCGNKKMKHLRAYNSGELETMKRWKVDPEFLAQFEGGFGDDEA